MIDIPETAKLFLVSTYLLAYVGPGLGLGTLIIIAALALSVLVAVVAMVWYPLKRLWRRLRGREEPAQRDQEARDGE